MRRPRRHRSATIALVAICAALLPAAATPRTTAIDAVPGRYLVRTAGAHPPAALLARAGARYLRALSGGRWHVVSFGGPAASLARVSGITAVEPDYLARVAASPDDPCVGGPCEGTGLWNLYATAAPLAWDASPGRFLTAQQKVMTNQVKVAVIDTTLDGLHPDFANRGDSTTDASGGGQLDGEDARSWIPAERRAGSQAYHGTFVAGIIGAATNNGTDVAGVGYAAQIMPLAAVAGDGTTDAATLADAIRFAWQRGARVINLSLGLTADSSAVHQAIVDATTGEHAALVVAAAGNNSGNAPFYPGSYPEVMSVSGFDANGRFAQCSNYNDNVSVSAPGAGVLSLAPMPSRRAVISCGTSAAAAHVSGIAALLFGQDPSRTPAAVRSIIQRTADDDGEPGWDQKFGWGRVNADRALHEGRGAAIGAASASTPTRGRPTSTIEATAKAPAPITAAEAYLDRPGDRTTRIELHPADGSWGSTTERVTATVEVPESVSAGPHPLFVRAFAGEWGAAARTILYVDRTSPSITNVRTTNVTRPLTARSTIAFTLSDDHSTTFDWSVTIDGIDGSSWRIERAGVQAGAQSAFWNVPASALPGRYAVTIWAMDEAGNLGAATATVIVF